MIVGSREYVLAGRTTTAFHAFHEAVCDRHYDVFESDSRHLRLGFRIAGKPPEAATVVRCAVLDAGHGLTKLVLVCFDDASGAVVAPAAALDRLLVEVEHRVQDQDRQWAIARAS